VILRKFLILIEVSLLLIYFPVIEAAKEDYDIYLIAGEEMHLSNENIVIQKNGIRSGGILTFDNCSVNVNYKEVNIPHGRTFINFSYFENINHIHHYGYSSGLLIKNSTFKNVDRLRIGSDRSKVSNSTFINLNESENPFQFYNCVFLGGGVLGDWDRYNTILIELYVDNILTHFNYTLNRNGEFFKNCTNSKYSVLNQSKTQGVVSNFTYTASVIIDNIYYSKSFTALPNSIIELQSYRDRDLDGTIDLIDSDIDNDDWSNEDEILYGTDKNDSEDFPPDMDGDHIPDRHDDDMDGDGWNNSIEIQAGTDPEEKKFFPYDYDFDGIPDTLDDDIDGDGWNNSIEIEYNTDPRDWSDYPRDYDLDGILDVLDEDIDGDGWNNTIEEYAGTDQFDEWEHPEDQDNDGILDFEDDDIDGDGWNNSIEEKSTSNPYLNSSVPQDWDLDGIPDILDDDLDGDGWNNTVEMKYLTDQWDNFSFPNDLDLDGIPDPEDDDIDGDGWNNTMESNAGTDPHLAEDFPSDIDLDNDTIMDFMDEDIDGDGVNNDNDTYPYDPSRWEEEIILPDPDNTIPPKKTPKEKNESRALLLILGTLGIVFLNAIILILTLHKSSKKKTGPEDEHSKQISTVEAEIEGIDRGFACKPEKVRRGLKRTTSLKYKMKGSAKVPKVMKANSEFLLTEASLPENFPKTTPYTRRRSIEDTRIIMPYRSSWRR